MVVDGVNIVINNMYISDRWAIFGFGEEIQTQNFNNYSINEPMVQMQILVFFHNWTYKLFSEENTVPEARKGGRVRHL